MQILLGIIIAVVVGVGAHFLLPGRDTRGAVLAPAIAAAFGAATWTILTWAGLAVDNPLLWLAAVVVPIALTVPVVLWMASARTRADAAERERLKLT